MSNRSVDSNGFLHVKDNVLTSAGISEYLGSEILNYDKYGLDKDKKYRVYRPKEELEKSKDSFNNLLLLNEHVPISRDTPRKDLWIGSTGTDSYVDNDGKLRNSIVFNEPHAISKAENGEINGLSCCYWYDIEVPQNKSEYDLIMRNIEGNHVAFVKTPRVNDARVSDSILQEKNGIYMKMDKIIRMLVKKPKKSRAMDGYDDVDVNAAEEMAQDDGMDDLLNAVMEICGRDEGEFEGGIEGKKSAIKDLILNFHDKAEQEEQEAMDEKEDKKDNKEDEDIEDKKEKSQAMDSVIQQKVEKRVKEEMQKIMAFDSAIDAATKLIGKVNKDSFACDASKVYDYILKANNVVSNGKTFESKKDMVEVLLSQKHKKKNVIAMDSAKEDGILINGLDRYLGGR